MKRPKTSKELFAESERYAKLSLVFAVVAIVCALARLTIKLFMVP